MNEAYVCDFASPSDAPGWMRLVEAVKDNFPGLVMEDYRRVLMKNIERGSAICVRLETEVVGALLFSTAQRTLSFLAVHPAHRRNGLAATMVEKMLTAFPGGEEISVTTFRGDDPLGAAPRALYMKLGFQAAELVTEFGHPCQRFVLKQPPSPKESRPERGALERIPGMPG